MSDGINLTAARRAAAPWGRLSANGNQITVRSSSSEVPVCLRGINRSSFQYLPSLRAAGMEDPEAELRLWRELWDVEIVRFPIGPDTYLRDGAYRDDVDRVIAACAAVRIYLILELHGRSNDYQIALPTAEAEPTWRDLAQRHGRAEHLAFDLWNEPHDVTWSTWQQAAQPLIDAIRHEGAADTLIVAGGLDWAYDLSPVLQAHNRLQGHGPLAYATHPYPFKGSSVEGPAQWEQRFGRVARELPVLVTEYGCDTEGDPFFNDAAQAERWLELLFDYLDERQLCALAWSGGNRPHLVLGRSGAPVDFPHNPPDPHQPTAPFGLAVQRWMTLHP